MEKTIIKLLGDHGGELDRVELNDIDATTEAIQRAVILLASRCTLHVGDRITIEEI